MKCQSLFSVKKKKKKKKISTSGDNLHEMSEPIFWKKKIRKNIIDLSSADSAQGVVELN